MLYKSPAIGKPIANTQIYILDRYLQLVPIGVKGEMYIGGDGVARGYLNNPQMTQERFIDNPFGSGKIYKTGDFAKYLPDGNIEFLGRVDNQVKIRGFRIELGEIESTLNQHPQVDKNLVLVLSNEQKDQRLVAYIVPSQTQIPTPSQLREYLKSRLPEYMIPSAYIPLEAFPLNANGKIDRHALPSPQREHSFNTEVVLPRNETETRLAHIWQEVLWLEQDISVNDNFFDLGGHSLLSVQLINKIEAEFKQDLPLQTLFQLGTIAEIAKILDGKKSSIQLVEEPIQSTPQKFNQAQLNPEIYQKLLAYTAAWQGTRANPRSLLFGHNLQGEQKPLFWVCQGSRELSQLAKYLDPQQPIYGMRSTHLIIKFDQKIVRELADYYAEKIIEIQPQEPYFLGGNCQSSSIAFYIAESLQKRGKQVGLLCLLENSTYRSYKGKIAFICGRDNYKLNPYLKFFEPEKTWENIYPLGFVTKMISGMHGHYFNEPYVQELAQVITELLNQTQAEIKLQKQVFNSEKYQAQIDVDCPKILPLNQTINLTVKIKNISSVDWVKNKFISLKVANHWLSKSASNKSKNNQYVKWIDGNTSLEKTIVSEEELAVNLKIKTPDKEGEYTLEIDLLEDGITWFSRKGSQTYQEIVQIQENVQPAKKYLVADNSTSLISENNLSQIASLTSISADQNFDRGNYQKALQDYEQLLNKNRDDLTNLYWKLAFASQQNYLLSKSVAYCQIGLSIDGNDPRFYKILAEIFQKQNQFQQAIICYQKTIDLGIKEPKIYFNFATLLTNQNQLAEAEIVANQGIKIFPTYSYLYQISNQIYKKTKQYHKAIQNYHQMLKFEPDQAERIYLELANLYLQLNDTEQVNYYQEKVREKQLNDVEVTRKLARSYQQSQQLEKAIEVANNLIKQDSKIENYQLLSKIYYQNKQYQLAKETLEQALKIDPQDYQVLKDLMQINLVLKQYSAVIDNCQQMSKINPQDFKTILILSNTYLLTNQLEKSYLYLQKATEINPQNPNIYALLGNIFQQQNQEKKAIVSYQKSLELNYSNPVQILSTIAQIQTQQGNFKSAIENYQKALELQPQNSYLQQMINRLQQHNFSLKNLNLNQ